MFHQGPDIVSLPNCMSDFVCILAKFADKNKKRREFFGQSCAKTV